MISYIKNKKLRIVSDKKNCNYTPSIVYFGKKFFKVGWYAKRKVYEDPVNTISSIKRFIGFSIKDIHKKYPILPYEIQKKNNEIIFQTQFGLIKISDIIQIILKYLLKKTTKENGNKILGAVITVPAHFNNIQKNEIRKAAKIIKLKILRLLNEPTAAAIAYGLEKKQHGIICIYDLGGGTFDTSILKISKGIFEVLATNGNCHLGGDDFDILIADFICSQLNIPRKLTAIEYKNLLIKSEKIKIKLSKKKKVKTSFLNQKIKCTRDNFEFLISTLIQKTIKILKQSLFDANIHKDNIDEIILVGGSTYIPFIRHTLKNFFSKKVLSLINPCEVVVRGAGLHAYFLNNQKKSNHKNPVLLLDVLPISIGIELMGGIMEKMILKNTTLPIETSKIFTNFKKNQTGFCINVYQGEQKYVKDCQLLTKFKVKNLPKNHLGKIKIIVTFQIDVDGLLNIFVKDEKLDIQKNIKIDTMYHYI